MGIPKMDTIKFMLKIICDTKKCGKDIKKIVAKPKPGQGIQLGKQHFCFECLTDNLEFDKSDISNDFKIK